MSRLLNAVLVLVLLLTVKCPWWGYLIVALSLLVVVLVMALERATRWPG